MLMKNPQIGNSKVLLKSIQNLSGRLAEEMGLSGVIKGLGHLPHDQVLRLIKSADLLLAINYEGWSTLIPGKIYEYWAAGGPPVLLLSCPGAAQSLLERHQLGIAVTPHDVEAIQ